jgi:hypothetical protein
LEPRRTIVPCAVSKKRRLSPRTGVGCEARESTNRALVAECHGLLNDKVADATVLMIVDVLRRKEGVEKRFSQLWHSRCARSELGGLDRQAG